MDLKKSKHGITMTAATRRQTPEEQRRFEAALELLLTEMVRQEITSRGKRQYEQGETTQG
jgi:hypothetical protein